MAHNAYYPPQTPQHGQQVPLAQQQQQGSSPGGPQYTQYYQQPQNIYQQLGQAQPQPHLQRFYQQPQFQQQPVYSQPPVQSHGFVQRPLSASFQAPQQSFTSSFQQQPAAAQQQPFQGSQFANLQQPPQPLSRAPSASGFTPAPSFVAQPNPPQGFANPVQGQPPQVTVPDPKLRPPIAPSAMLAQQVQRRTPQPLPPVQAAPSQMQIRPPQPMQMQQQQQPIQMQIQPQQPPVQQVPQTPNLGSRRPLPQPAGGGSGPVPPPAVGPSRSGTMASRPISMPPTATGRLPPISTSAANFGAPTNPNQPPQPMSASAIPPPSFVQRQIQQIQQMQSEGKLPVSSSSSTSPTKNRPLPAAPGVKPSSIDLGKLTGLPSINTGSGFNFNSASPASPISSGRTGTPEDSGPPSSSPTKRMTLPSPMSGGSSGLNFGGGGGSGGMSLSRTTSMAFSSNQANSAVLSALENDNDNTPKRRASPPKFGAGGSNGSSLSSSPTKEDGPRMGWNSNTSLTGSPTKSTSGNTVFGGSNRSSTNLSATNPTSSAGGVPNLQKPGSFGTTMSSTAAMDGSTPKKFTPVWKRTIPDYPAPVFGYAAGMVADPFAKPSNASSSNLSSSPTKSDAGTPTTTPKATSKQSAATLAKEKKKQEKEEKKRLKEEEKQRKKMAKTNGGNLVMQQQQASPGGSPGGGSMLPYLHPTPPRAGGAAGEHSKAYTHGHNQVQHTQQRIAMQKAHGTAPFSTPTRQIQVRGQPVAPGAVRTYSQPLAQEESTEDDDQDEDEEEEEEDEDEENSEQEEDLEVAYQYEGSDYSSASEQEYAMARAPQRQQRHQEHQQQAYAQQQQQQYMAPAQKVKKPGTSPRQQQQYDEYEEQQRPSPRSRHVKTRSSASDGFVLIDQSGNSPGGRNKANRRSAAASSSSRPSSSHARGQSLSYSHSEDDWEQLQAYESSPRKSKPSKGKGRRYEEPSEEDDEEEEESYEDTRGRGSGHRREPSERDGNTMRRLKSREPEYDDYSESRGGRGTAKQQQGRNVRERVQDIDWNNQQPKQGKLRQYQQQLKYDDDDDDDEDERGRRTKSAAVAKKQGKGSLIKDMLRSRSRSKGRFTEPEDEEDQDEYGYERPKSQSPTKKAPPRKLIKKNSRRYLNSAASETDSQPDSRDGDDNESVTTTNTQNTTESATSRLASKFAGVLKFTGGSNNQQTPKQVSPQKSPTREWQTQQQQQQQQQRQPQQRQSGFQQGFQNPRGDSLYFGIADTPPTPATANTVTKQPPSATVRGELNRGKVNLKMDNLDDPPPRSLRTPSPAPGGKRQSMYQYPSEVEQQRQPMSRQQQQQGFQQKRPQSQIYSGTPRSSFMDDISGRSNNSAIVQPQSRRLPQPQQQQQQRPQSQGNQPTTFDSITGLPVHHQQAMQGYAPPPAPLARQPSQRQPPPQFNNRQSAPSTPHQQPINIESPAPLKMANIIKMEADGVAHEEHQHQQQQQQVQRQYTNPQYQNVPMINIGGPQDSQVASPRINIHHTGGTNMSSSTHHSSPSIPVINFDPAPSSSSIAMINVSGESSSGGGPPAPPNIQVYEVPGISVSGPEFDEGPTKGGPPQISISGSGNGGHHGHHHPQQQQRPFGSQQVSRNPVGRSRTGGLICGGCQGPIVGRIVSAMGMRWHPQCFRCSVCQELLEHVSSYEHDGRPYCHLDYHESFAPRCYSCKTPIIEEQFISLDDPALGKRTYHMEHFFCAECGDPFLTPSMSRSSGELALSGDGEFEGFTVYKGHPYCEACHVRLRLPKCKKCKKSIRDHERAVEALGGKWCWACFVCEGCSQPFEDPSFFQRDNKPYCEHCFSIILRNEV